jgi:DNA-binding NtrC family response regulator
LEKRIDPERAPEAQRQAPAPQREAPHAQRRSELARGSAVASAALGAFTAEIARVAPTDVTVLIEGESGSGKNLAARALHSSSARCTAPLVEVQLTALAPTLIEAELFGYEAGAFTGAQSARTGRFLRAQGGSLVLDGVECLPLEMQVKLLRVLQERAVEPLGSEQAHELDVRVIALSSRDLAGEVRAGRFREDLYHRLAVIRLRVPPLRARGPDLPALCAHFLRQAAVNAGVRERALTPEAAARLAAHAWPGNLRELENAIERVTVLVPDAALGGAHPPPIEASELDFLFEAADGVTAELARKALAHGVGLDDLERALLNEALREQRGNVSAAARRLGLSRRAFEHRYARGNEDRDPGAEAST